MDTMAAGALERRRTATGSSALVRLPPDTRWMS